MQNNTELFKYNTIGSLGIQKRKTPYSVSKVVLNGKTVGFLTATMEQKGFDIYLDTQGYTIISL